MGTHGSSLAGPDVVEEKEEATGSNQVMVCVVPARHQLEAVYWHG